MGDPLWHTLDLAKDASVEEIIGVVARDPQVVAILFTIRPDAAHSRSSGTITVRLLAKSEVCDRNWSNQNPR